MNSSNPTIAPTGASSCGLHPIGLTEALNLARTGYTLRDPLFDATFADRLIEEIDRLIELGIIPAVPDRMVRQHPTEWVSVLGIVSGNHLDGPLWKASPLVRRLFEDLQNLGRSYNSVRETMIAGGCVTEAEAPPIAVDGMEMNLSRVIGSQDARWSGHALHQDTHRFNPGMQALPQGSVQHNSIRARAFTVSGYARPLGSDGERRNDWGGGLPFLVRPSARNMADKSVFDIVPANHNTGALFFPHTTHGVSRMPATNSVRYSFQAFYPASEAWKTISKRLSQ